MSSSLDCGREEMLQNPLVLRGRPRKSNISRKLVLKGKGQSPTHRGSYLLGGAGREEPVLLTDPTSRTPLEAGALKGCVSPSFSP